MVTEDSFQEKMFMLMKEMTGASNNIAVSRLYCKAMGGLTGGVFLSQLVYWCDKGAREDGYIWKTNEEWEEETYLSKYEVTKARKVLEDAGVLETMVKKVCGNPTLHYKLLRKPFIDWLVKFFTKESEILEEGKSNISLSLTKTTLSNTTSKNTTTSKKVTPAVVPVVAPIFKNNEETVSESDTTGNDDILSSITMPLPKGILPKHIIKLANRKELQLKSKSEIVTMINSALVVVKNYNNPRSTPAILTSAVMEGYDSPIEPNLPGLELKQVQEHFKKKELEWNKATTEGSTVDVGALIAGLRAKHGMPVETELNF